MNKYIDAEWLLRFFKPFGDNYHTPLGALRACIDDAPYIDIVHCKDCRYCKKKHGTFKGEPIIFYRCTENNRDVESDDFCSLGERSRR